MIVGLPNELMTDDESIWDEWDIKLPGSKCVATNINILGSHL